MMFSEYVAWVTGSSTGIGAASAVALAGQGCRVAVHYNRSEDEAREVVERISSAGGEAMLVGGDVADTGEVERMAGEIEGRYGRLDVLVNNAGISHASKPGTPFEQIILSNSLTTAPLEDVRKVWETNVFGVIAVTQAMLPLLREAPAGRIVNIGSDGGSLTRNSDPTNPHRAVFGNYSASKTALHAITLAFAFALESTGIKVNIASPGLTSTALNNFNGTRSVEEGAREPVRLALIGADGPTGTFSDEDGPVPW